MLYSIIPPILIILSLAGIIIFLVKKSSQIANLEEDVANDFGDSQNDAGRSFFQKIIAQISNIDWSSVRHFFLMISEKITRQARIFFLKLESKSRSLNDTIRNTRNKYKAENGNKLKTGVENSAEDDIIDKLHKYQPQDKTDEVEEKIVSEEVKYVENKIIRPTVSDRVVTPRSRVEMKDRLEDLLIERIAANPKDVEAYERLGEYYMEINSLDDAKECFKQVLRLDPKNRNVKYRIKKLETMIYGR